MRGQRVDNGLGFFAGEPAQREEASVEPSSAVHDVYASARAARREQCVRVAFVPPSRRLRAEGALRCQRGEEVVEDSLSGTLPLPVLAYNQRRERPHIRMGSKSFSIYQANSFAGSLVRRGSKTFRPESGIFISASASPGR